MKSFTSSNLDVIRRDIDKALEGVAKKHSIALKIGGIKYSSDQFHTKLEAFIQDASTSGMNARQIEGLKNLKNYGSLYNVSEKDFGKKFTNWDGQTFKFVGLMPSRPKYPVLGENVRTGKLFKFTESVLTKLEK
jgi:hypothetical protein